MKERGKQNQKRETEGENFVCSSEALRVEVWGKSAAELFDGDAAL